MNAETAPDVPLGVDLFRDVLRRLNDEAEWALKSNPTGAAEVAGILLGNCGPIIEIGDSEPVLLMQEQDRAYALTGPGSLEFKRMMATFSASGSERRAVGFYRSHIGERAELGEEDFTLIRGCFGETPQVVLLMNGTSSVRLFLGDRGSGLVELCPEANASPEIGSSNHEAVHASKDLTHAGTSIPATRGVEEISPALKWRSFRYVSMCVAQVLVAALLGYMILKGSWRLKKSEISAPGGLEATSNGSSQPGLTLRVEWRGENLRLSWDHETPALIKAKGGTLTIREGNAPGREVLLDGDLLRTGSVEYRPVERHVSFRLAIFGPDSGTVADSVVASP
jgi:hypothetical protein